MATTLTTAARNVACDAVTALAGVNSKLKIYTAAFASLLSTSIVSSWGASVAGVSTAGLIADVVIAASGTAAVCRVTDSADTEIWRGTVGTVGADVTVNSTTFSSGGNLAVSAATYTQPAS